MTDFRQMVTEAAVAELRRQLGEESVDCHGTWVQVDGSFRMARLIEAIIRAALIDHPRIIEEVARTVAPGRYGADWEEYKSAAGMVIGAVRGRILEMLDPLP